MMIDRNVDAMVKAIRHFELDVGEGFADYFMASWPVGSWFYFLLGKGHTEWANELINDYEKDGYVCQEKQFEWFDAYCGEGESGWDEDIYLKNVRVWAEFLVESDQYYRRVNEFFAEYNITMEDVVSAEQETER
jgi:hypothetical protein